MAKNRDRRDDRSGATGGSDGTATAPPTPAPTLAASSPAPAAPVASVTPPTPQKSFWERVGGAIFQKNEHNKVYALRSAGGAIVAVQYLGNNYRLPRNQPFDFAQQAKNLLFLGYAPKIPGATKVEARPLRYPDNDRVRILVQNSKHVQDNLVEGLDETHRYPMEFVDVELAGGFSITLRFYVNVKLVLPIIGFERGSDVIIEMGSFLRAAIQKTLHSVDLSDVLNNPDKAGQKTAERIKEVIADVLDVKINGQTCEETCGYDIVGMELLDLVLPENIQKIVNARAQILVLDAEKEQADRKKEIKITQAVGDAAIIEARLRAQTNGMRELKGVIGTDPTLTRIVISQIDADALVGAAKEIGDRKGDGDITFLAGNVPSGSPVMNIPLKK